MDQRSLVSSQIDDGLALGKQLVADGFEVAALFWVLEEERPWLLYVALPAKDENTKAGIAVVAARQKIDSPWLGIGLGPRSLGAKDPITQAVLELMRRRPGPIGRFWPEPVLGSLKTEVVYVYPPLAAPSAVTPRVRVVGVRSATGDGSAKPIEDEIGFVEGVLGGAEFSTKLAELVIPRFGSLEQFQSAYSRIVLEKA